MIITTVCAILVSGSLGVIIGQYLSGIPDDTDALSTSRGEIATPMATPLDLPPLFRIESTAA
jgi:hypothetical protein